MTEENEKLPSLPQGWIWTRLEELADIVDVDHKMPRSVKDGVHFISPKDFVDPEGIDFENAKRISEEDFQRLARKCKPESGDLIYSRIGTIGKVRKVPCDALFHVSYSLCLIKPVDMLKESDILYVFLKSPSVLKQALAKRRSIGVPDLGLGDIKKFTIPLAPLNEQKRIVRRVEELFSRLDAGVEGLRNVKAQLKRYRQAVLKYAFEGKLTEEWRKTHKDQMDPCTKLLERVKEERKKKLGPKYKEPPPIDVSELPELPQSWKWVRLGEVSDTSSGGTPSRKKKEYYGGSIPWLKSGELKDDVINVTEESITDDGLVNSSTRIIPKGTLLIALYGATVGKLGILGIDSAINQAVCAIFPDGGISRDFLFWYLRKHRNELLNIRKGGAQPNISQDVIRNIVLPIPSLKEQQTIVEEVENRMSSIREVEAILEEFATSRTIAPRHSETSFRGETCSSRPK